MTFVTAMKIQKRRKTRRKMIKRTKLTAMQTLMGEEGLAANEVEAAAAAARRESIHHQRLRKGRHDDTTCLGESTSPS